MAHSPHDMESIESRIGMDRSAAGVAGGGGVAVVVVVVVVVVGGGVGVAIATPLVLKRRRSIDEP